MPFWNNIICIQNFNVFIRFPPPPLSFPYNFCWRTCVVWPVEFLTRCLTHTFVLCVSWKLAAGFKAWSDYRWWGAFPSRGKYCLVDCHFVLLAHCQIQRSANLCEPNQIQLLFFIRTQLCLCLYVVCMLSMATFAPKPELSSFNCAMCPAKPTVFTVYLFIEGFADPWHNSLIVI